MFDFGDYRVIVTGGSRSIGLGIADAFVKAGASVSICGRDREALSAAHGQLAAFGRVHSQRCDLADRDSVSAYVGAAASALGGIDVLVNNASGFGRADDEEGWGRAVAVDLMATTRASRAALPWLRRSANPSLIHITSSAAFKPSVAAPAYSAIKAALVHFTRSQAKILAGETIRVNSVAPGSTEAPGHFYEQRRLSGDPSYDRIRATIPTGRLGTPQEIAEVVLFFASPAARWVTGQTIVADGGQHLFDDT